MVKECYNWIEKFKSGVTKKGKVTFEIYSILASLGEKLEIVKVAAESYIKILDQHNLKISEHSGEEELVKRRPLTLPEHHVILPDHLQDQN